MHIIQIGLILVAGVCLASVNAVNNASHASEPPSSTPAPWQHIQKPDSATLRAQLTALEYHVTQEDGTETPFNNRYWDNKAAGIYVDIITGEPLFSSLDKYKSGTGWPSFIRPLAPENIVEKIDFSLIWPRTEIRSQWGDNHIGHVFKDGPEPTGLRYCMNSAAMRFVPVEDMAAAGYEAFLPPFIEAGLIK